MNLASKDEQFLNRAEKIEMKVRTYKILVRSKELTSNLKRKRIEKVKKWKNKIFVNLALKKNNKNETDHQLTPPPE